jgi:hypothetical protein
VKGLAKFTEEHHLEFGRLMFGRKKSGLIQIVDVSDNKTRQSALKMGAPADLESKLGTAASRHALDRHSTEPGAFCSHRNAETGPGRWKLWQAEMQALRRIWP